MDDLICDYRKPECSNTGVEVEGRWYCVNHLPTKRDPRSASISPINPDERTHTERAIIDSFWKVWNRAGYGSGQGNAVLYDLLHVLNGD
jgi:hypothetical protein